MPAANATMVMVTATSTQYSSQKRRISTPWLEPEKRDAAARVSGPAGGPGREGGPETTPQPRATLSMQESFGKGLVVEPPIRAIPTPRLAGGHDPGRAPPEVFQIEQAAPSRL